MAPYAGILVPVRPEGWPPLTGQVAQSTPEYSIDFVVHLLVLNEIWSSTKV